MSFVSGHGMDTIVEDDGDSVPSGFEFERSSSCKVCGEKLGKRFLRPRHHCRVCQQSVCNSCSPGLVELADRSGLHRVCRNCEFSDQKLSMELEYVRAVAERSVSPAKGGHKSSRRLSPVKGSPPRPQESDFLARGSFSPTRRTANSGSKEKAGDKAGGRAADILGEQPANTERVRSLDLPLHSDTVDPSLLDFSMMGLDRPSPEGGRKEVQADSLNALPRKGVEASPPKRTSLADFDAHLAKSGAGRTHKALRAKGAMSPTRRSLKMDCGPAAPAVSRIFGDSVARLCNPLGAGDNGRPRLSSTGSDDSKPEGQGGDSTKVSADAVEALQVARDAMIREEQMEKDLGRAECEMRKLRHALAASEAATVAAKAEAAASAAETEVLKIQVDSQSKSGSSSCGDPEITEPRGPKVPTRRYSYGIDVPDESDADPRNPANALPLSAMVGLAALSLPVMFLSRR